MSNVRSPKGNRKPRLPKGTVNDGYEDVALDKIQPHPKNPRRGNVAAIVSSIKANGFYGAVAVQRSTKFIVAGNHRYLAAQELGMETVPVIWLDIDDDKAVRVLLADNRTSDIAGYDEAAVMELLGELAESGPDALLGSGYDDLDVEGLLRKVGGDPLDDVLPPDGFGKVDPGSIKTTHECPKCGYEWSGKAKGQKSIGIESVLEDDTDSEDDEE